MTLFESVGYAAGFAIHAILLYLVVSRAHMLAPLIGGSVAAALSMAMLLPVVGGPYSRIVNELRLHLAFKLVGWGIAGSGALLGYLLYSAIFGPPADEPLWYVLFGVALVCISISAKPILMLEFDPKDYMSMLLKVGVMKKGFAKFGSTQAQADRMFRVALASFIDTYISSFISLLSALALLFLALGSAGVIETASGQPPTLLQALGAALSLPSLVASQDQFVGSAWTVVRAGALLLVVVWVTVYISLASSLVRDEDFKKLAASTATGVPDHQAVSSGAVAARNETLPQLDQPA